MKIRGNIRNKKLITGIQDRKFFHISDKLITGVVVSGAKLPPASLLQVIADVIVTGDTLHRRLLKI
jgi:hypothetical protein